MNIALRITALQQRIINRTRVEIESWFRQAPKDQQREFFVDFFLPMVIEMKMLPACNGSPFDLPQAEKEKYAEQLRAICGVARTPDERDRLELSVCAIWRRFKAHKAAY